MNAYAATVSEIPVTSAPQPDIAQQVKLAHRSYPTGVTVVTASVDGVPVGLAVNAFSSVSMEPPMVLVCVNSSSRSHAALSRASHLGISILSHDQAAIAGSFARSGGDKFSDVAWHAGEHGAPILDAAASAFEIEVVDRITAGTHSVFLGRVVGVETSARPALVYAAGQFFDGGQLIPA